MVAVIKPILLSTPFSCNIFVAIPIDALPEIGLNIANGIISIGIFKAVNIGEIKSTIKLIIPELFNKFIAKNIANKVGNNSITIFIPFFAPTINISYTFLFSIIPYAIIKTIINGIIIVEI